MSPRVPSGRNPCFSLCRNNTHSKRAPGQSFSPSFRQSQSPPSPGRCVHFQAQFPPGMSKKQPPLEESVVCCGLGSLQFWAMLHPALCSLHSAVPSSKMEGSGTSCSCYARWLPSCGAACGFFFIVVSVVLKARACPRAFFFSSICASLRILQVTELARRLLHLISLHSLLRLSACAVNSCGVSVASRLPLGSVPTPESFLP